MPLPFSLAPDEGVVLKETEAGDEDLYLTNKRIVRVELGFFGRVTNLDETPLHTIKVFNNEAQVFLDCNSDEIEIFTFNGDSFMLELVDFLEARQWADAISNLLVGHPSMQAAQEAREYEAAHAPRGLGGLISSAGDMAGALGSKLSLTARKMRENTVNATIPVRGTVPRFTPENAYVVAETPMAERPVASIVAQQPESAPEQPESEPEQPEDMPEQPAAMSLDEQIAAVKGLKELLDADILTQEEFDQKKREVMGL